MEKLAVARHLGRLLCTGEKDGGSKQWVKQEYKGAMKEGEIGVGERNELNEKNAGAMNYRKINERKGYSWRAVPYAHVHVCTKSLVRVRIMPKKLTNSMPLGTEKNKKYYAAIYFNVEIYLKCHSKWYRVANITKLQPRHCPHIQKRKRTQRHAHYAEYMITHAHNHKSGTLGHKSLVAAGIFSGLLHDPRIRVLIKAFE